MSTGPIEGPVLPLSTGAPWPAAATVRAFIDEDRVVTLRFRVRDGRPVLIGLAVGSHEPVSPAFAEALERDAPEVTPSVVRSIPVAELTKQAVRAVALSVAAATRAGFRYDGAVAAEQAEQAARRNRAMTRTHLSEVAQIAAAYPDDPIGEICRQMFTSRRSAYRWVSVARKRGLLDDKEER